MSRKPYDVAAHLDRVRELIVERGAKRDLPQGERTIPRAVRAFNAVTGHELSARDGWLFMCMLKLARMQAGKFTADDYDDHTGYSALMAEQARAEHDAAQPRRRRK